MPLCWSTQTFLNETTASGAVSVANLRPARVEFRNDVCEARGTGFFQSTFFARSKKVDMLGVEIKPRCHSEGEAEESSAPTHNFLNHDLDSFIRIRSLRNDFIECHSEGKAEE